VPQRVASTSGLSVEELERIRDSSYLVIAVAHGPLAGVES
jgi:hypothetical protein